MHMADALLSPEVGTVMWAVSAGASAYATKKITDTDMSEKKLPIMAVSGAFVFTAQMINFTIPGTGSSGHISGGILLAALLGEFPALITLAAVLTIQCLFFADGGLLALGANIFNMGVIPCLLIYPIFFRPFLQKKITKGKIVGATFLSTIIALQLGAFSVVLETLASGITKLPFHSFVLIMQPIHLAIGIGEGLVTASVLIFVWHMRPEILSSSVKREKLQTDVPVRKIAIVFAFIALMTGGILSFYASSHPDGLEWSVKKVAGTSEIEAEDTLYRAVAAIQEKLSFLPDYDFKEGNGTGTGISGIVGALITSALAFLSGLIITGIKKRRKK